MSLARLSCPNVGDPTLVVLLPRALGANAGAVGTSRFPRGSAPALPGRDSCQRGWRLLYILAAYYKCSEVLRPFLLAFLQDASSRPELPFQGGCWAHGGEGRPGKGALEVLQQSHHRGSAASFSPVPVPTRHRQSLRAKPAENSAVRWPQPLPQQHGAPGHGGEAGCSWLLLGARGARARASCQLEILPGGPGSPPMGLGCPPGHCWPLAGTGSTLLFGVCSPGAPLWGCPELRGVPGSVHTGWGG